MATLPPKDLRESAPLLLPASGGSSALGRSILPIFASVFPWPFSCVYAGESPPFSNKDVSH